MLLAPSRRIGSLAFRVGISSQSIFLGERSHRGEGNRSAVPIKSDFAYMDLSSLMIFRYRIVDHACFQGSSFWLDRRWHIDKCQTVEIKMCGTEGSWYNDRKTEEAVRGRFARLCVEVDLTKPLLPKLWIGKHPQRIEIGKHPQRIEYEGLRMLCFQCGRFWS